MKYRIVRHIDLDTFEGLVNDCIKESWELHGDLIALISDEGDKWLYQAMIKREQ